MAKNKLTIGKMAYTVYGGSGTVVQVDGDNVTIGGGLFGDITVKLHEVFHSRAKAWGPDRAV